MKTKKLIALLLSLVMVIGLLPTMALAENVDIHFTENGIKEKEYDSAVSFFATISDCGLTMIYIKTITAKDNVTITASVTVGGGWRNKVYNIGGTLVGSKWKNGDSFSETEKGNLSTNALTIKEKLSGLQFDDTCSSYYFAAFENGSSDYGLLIQVEGEAETITDEDKKPLQDLLDTVKDGNNAYHTSGDCWNGKTYDANGHWNTFIATTPKKGPRATAQAVLDDPRSKDEITNAVTDLQTAIAKLIPISQANTTELHDALDSYGTTNSHGGKSPYWTDASWNSFIAVRSEAQALMDSMFDKNGIATPANVYAAQADVEAKAAALTQAYNNLFPIVLNEKLGVWKAAAD